MGYELPVFFPAFLSRDYASVIVGILSGMKLQQNHPVNGGEIPMTGEFQDFKPRLLGGSSH